MVNPFSLINKLLPFATPGTPLIQDLLHLAALCTALYYAPQIQAYVQDHLREQGQHQPNQQAPDHVPEPRAQPEANGEQPVQPPQPFVEEAEEEDPEQPFHPGANEAFPPADQPFPDDGAPGPVNPRPQNAFNNTRTVGAKKAKSLARRDQRRAYHEFMRSQGEAQRARDAEGAAERDAQLEQERARRAAAEAELEAKRAKEREERRMKEEKAREEESERRERTVRIVRDEVERGPVDLEDVARRVGGGVGREWVEGLVRASGLLSASGENRAIATANGWVVKVSREDMEQLYREAADAADEQEGTVSYTDLGNRLENILEKKAPTAR